MTRPIAGLHHVTAIAGPARACVEFHAGVLGLRLVKRTVNFDDPLTWHLYFGDAAGGPGTLLTFFPWADAPRGRPGTGETAEVAFAVPAGSLDWWRDHLAAHGARSLARSRRLGEETLAFAAPDGLALALVGQRDGAAAPGTGGPVPPEHAVRGLHSITLALADPAPTAALLADVMGLTPAGDEDGRTRFAAAAGGARFVDLVARPGVARAGLGAGSVHHVAWRVADDADQAAWSEALTTAGRRLTPVADRCYFRSVYFREPGGVLFELATDGPGFAVDEPADALGRALRLPAWLEAQRARIERALPALDPPAGVEAR